MSASTGGTPPIVLDVEAIQRLLPHRPPFLLVDRVVEHEQGKRLVAWKGVTMNEPFFTGHFPGHAVMPGVLILEALAQAGGLLVKFSLTEDTSFLFMSGARRRFRQFLRFLREEKGRGRTLVLVTAADFRMAQPVADHVGLFGDVLASDGQTNLRGRAKGARLAERFGERQFDYAGNSRVDLPVWGRARRAIVVNARRGLAEKAARVTTLGRVFS